jgi:cytochrome c oxidase subunit 4
MNSDDTMTDTDTGVAAPTVADGHDAHDAHADEHRHKEPSDRQYIWIAIILAVLTALEILSTEIGPQGSLLVPMLLVLMFVKFWIVASFFMHLRFDSRLFSFLFYLGLGFAVVLYSAVLATFHFWTS